MSLNDKKHIQSYLKGFDLTNIEIKNILDLIVLKEKKAVKKFNKKILKYYDKDTNSLVISDKLFLFELKQAFGKDLIK